VVELSSSDFFTLRFKRVIRPSSSDFDPQILKRVVSFHPRFKLCQFLSSGLGLNPQILKMIGDVEENRRKLAHTSFNNEDANSRVNSIQLGEDDADQDAWEYLRKTQADASVKTPRKMVTLAQMRAAAKARPDP
jgi:hypothetical protein